MLDFLFVVIFILCITFRGIIFAKREQAWWKTLIPGYNKYILAKLSDYKKIGITLAIFSTLLGIVFLFKIAIEQSILEYASYYITEETTSLDDIIPAKWLNINNNLLWVIYVLAIITFILWVIVTRKFSDKQDSSTWWMIVWAICPVISYFYYAVMYKKYYIPERGLVFYEVAIKPVEVIKKNRVKKKKKKI